MRTVLSGSLGQLGLQAAADPWTPAQGEPVVVYGAGEFARAVVAAVRRHGGVVRHALDRRGGAASLDGLGVHSPEDDPMSLAERRTATAVIGVFNRDADPLEIHERLGASGYARIVGVPELYEAFGHSLGDHYWLGSRALYRRSSESISIAMDLWADAQSRELYQR